MSTQERSLAQLSSEIHDTATRRAEARLARHLERWTQLDVCELVISLLRRTVRSA
jgi:hypothetical protein